MTSEPTLLWFRRDLRLSDNPALLAAVLGSGPVIPVFVWSPKEESPWAPAGASLRWLKLSLESLEAALIRRGARLVFRSGPAAGSLRMLAAETGARAVFWNRCYEPAARARDAAVQTSLRRAGLRVGTFNSHLLFEPWEIKTSAGAPFRRFTPFWKACLQGPEPSVAMPAPEIMPAVSRWPKSEGLELLEKGHSKLQAPEILKYWQPGEKGAAVLLQRFLAKGIEGYDRNRDRPDMEGVSRLSPHLHFGEIGPRRIWQAVTKRAAGDRGRLAPAAQAFLRQIGWREFAYNLLLHFPDTTDEPLRPEFARFPWLSDRRSFDAWKAGRTGYPIVDAGMRELDATGWMHNRVRMIVASFLVKDLLQPWVRGAKWFWSTLVDADLANNTLGWQWVAGCGADASPYFRVFNPVLQGEKFDPDGNYVRRWVPELDSMAAKWIHKPWLAPAGAGPGRRYPKPIVDHGEARRRAYDAWTAIRK